MKLKDIVIREIFNSRSEPTLETEIVDFSGNKFLSQIASGKSKSSKEAVVFDFNQAKNILTGGLKQQILKNDLNSIKDFDEFLIGLDGTENKAKLGGNLILGLSIAFCRTLAFAKNQEVWQLLNQEFFQSKAYPQKPLIFANLINGGAHAQNNLIFQEYLVILKTDQDFNASIKVLINLYQQLGQFLKLKFDLKQLTLGDEAGYSLDFKDDFEPLRILSDLIIKNNYSDQMFLGLDAAASGFYKEGNYLFANKQIKTNELKQVYLDAFKEFNQLISIEDPFCETDFAGFLELKIEAKDKLIVADDLTSTRPELIEDFAKKNLINAVIIKPNQVGSVLETCQAILKARENNLKVIVSHRSSETEDNFIIHLAKAAGVDGVKIGAPARERILKFNELMRVFS